jgi:hypothetical protein
MHRISGRPDIQPDNPEFIKVRYPFYLITQELANLFMLEIVINVNSVRNSCGSQHFEKLSVLNVRFGVGD